MSRTQPRKNKTPGAGKDRLNSWLQMVTSAAVAAGLPITKVRTIRTSSSDVEQWLASAITSFAALEREKDPDVITALSYGMDLVRRDAAGEEKRAELGDSVFELMMCHAPGGVGARRIGVILHVGQTLFVYLLTSARANNLEADTEDRRGNASTEILSMTIRAVFAAGFSHDPTFRPELHAREHERIVRDENHGASLKRTLKDCRVIAFTPDRRDMLEPAAAQSFSFGTLISAGAVDALVKGMNRAEVVMQSNGAYYSDVKQVLFTHEPARTVETDPRTGVTYEAVNKHRLAVVGDVDEAKGLLRVLVDAVLKNRIDHRGLERPMPDWPLVADLPGVGELPSRLPADLTRGVLLKHKSSKSRVQSLKSILSRRWIEGLRTGWITVEVPLKTQIDVDFGDGVEIITKRGKRYARCRVEMPLPEGGWGISDEEWEEVLRRRYPGRRAEPTDDCHPLAGVTWEDQDADLQYRLTTRSRYVMQSRKLSAAASASGGYRGWHDGETPKHLATLTSHRLHAAVGRAGREALTLLDAPCAPVLLSQPVPTTVAVARLGASNRDRLVAAVTTAQDLSEGARKSFNTSLGALERARQATPDDVTEAEEEMELAKSDKESAAAELRAAKNALKSHDGRAVAGDALALADKTVALQTATPEFVVVALEKCRGNAPLWLNLACAKLFTDWRCHLVQEPGARDRVAWQCVMVLDVAGSDVTIRIPLQGELESSSNCNGSAAATTVEDWAWRFFYRGESFAQVGKAAGIDGTGKKNSFLYKSLHDWLAPAIPDVTLRTAALHCPVRAALRVFWVMVTGESDDLAGIDAGYAQHIMTTYSQPAWLAKWSWCRDTHANARLVAKFLLATPDARLPMHGLLARTQLSGDSLRALARENGKSTVDADNRRAPARAVAYFGKTFRRGAPTMKPKDKQLYLRACPHKDCPERVAGRQGYASLMINVPETEQWHAVICPHCMRLPDLTMANVRFPADYARPYSGRYGTQSLRSAARNQPDWTFLDVALTDPGPSAALPNTGAQPRPSQTQPGARAGAPPTQRGGRLGGRRVLPIALSTVEVLTFTDRLVELGGRAGQRVKPSLAAVVTGGDVTHEHPRVAVAAALGIPVMTLTQFLMWAPSAPATQEDAA